MVIPQARSSAPKELTMKTLFVLASVAAALAGCSYYNTPPAVAVAPAVTTTPSTVVVPTQPAPATTVVVPAH